jgi:hypothetical protein
MCCESVKIRGRIIKDYHTVHRRLSHFLVWLKWKKKQVTTVSLLVFKDWIGSMNRSKNDDTYIVKLTCSVAEYAVIDSCYLEEIL